MIKLLYITNGISGSGGLERVLSVKASLLADEYDYEVSILGLNAGNDAPFYHFSPKIALVNIRVSGNPLQYIHQYRTGIQKELDRLQPDIISVCDDGLKGFFVPTLIKTKAKIIYERHASIQLNTSSSLKGRISKILMRSQAKKFDRFVVLTPSNIKEWKENNIVAISNPLSFTSELISTLQNKKVMAVGSHSYNKGYDLLLDSWRMIEEKYPDWELHVYGKIDKDETFIKYAQHLALKQVYFHAPVSDIQLKYAEASVFVLPSRTEGFGMVLIEAMACGVPCVSFDCPSGPADIIADSEDGWLVEKENVEQLAEKLTALIKDEKLRKKMGQAARENVKRYEAGRIVQVWDELFQSLKID